MIKFMSELKKIVWGLFLTFGIVYLMCLGLSCRPENHQQGEPATIHVSVLEKGLSLFYFYDRGKMLRKELYNCVIENSPERLRKTLAKYEKWEKEYNSNQKEEYEKIDHEALEQWEKAHNIPETLHPRLQQSFLSVYYREFLCEMECDWDSALKCAEEFTKLRGDDPYKQPTFASDFRGEGFKARIHYKMGERRQAFIDYCDIAPSSEIIGKDAAGYLKYQYFLKGGKKRSSSSEPLLWRFHYDDFLRFIDEEYEALGKPEEYKEAVEVYHAIAAD